MKPSTIAAALAPRMKGPPRVLASLTATIVMCCASRKGIEAEHTGANASEALTRLQATNVGSSRKLSSSIHAAICSRLSVSGRLGALASIIP